jgi:outer membrane protein assembly factor BamB
MLIIMKRVLFFAVFGIALSSVAENWPQWRGPAFNGSTAEKGLPTQWSKTDGVAWVTPLPGHSGATPVIWDDTIFLSSPNEQKELLLLCVDRPTGKVRWQKVVATGDAERGRNNMASPSPVTDGKRVFILFGTGDLAAFDFAGNELWKRNLAKEYGVFSINWLYGSSPMLYKDKLYVQVLQHNPPEYGHAKDDKPERESFLLCVDPGTGKNLWRQLRTTDAFSEAQESYATPIPYEAEYGPEIILVGANYVTAHSAASGDELWRCGGLNDKKEAYWRIVPTPVTCGDMVFACGPKRDPVLGIRDGGHGVVTDTQTVWKFKEYPSDCVTPLVYHDRLYVLDGDRQMMTCLDPKTGEKHWQGNLGVRDIFRASPTGADGKIYCLSEAGTVVVLDAGPEFKVLSSILMGEAPVRSSIAVAHGELFIRTAQNLYCVGNKETAAAR